MGLSDWVQVLTLAFLGGAFWQRTGTLNETLKDMKQSFDQSIKVLTERVNDHGERLGRIEGRLDQ